METNFLGNEPYLLMLIIIYIFLLIFLIVFYNFAPETMDKINMAELLIIALICVILFFFKKERSINLKGQYLKHSTLAIIGILIVFFQYPLDFILGNVSESNLFLWVNPKIVLRSLTLSVIGLICFMIGYLAFHKSSAKNHPNQERPVKVNILNSLAAIALIIYFIMINPLYLAGFYGIVDMGPEATYAITFFQIFTCASIIQKCRNILLLNTIPVSFMQFIKKIGWPLIILIASYLLSVIISGDRGPIMFFGLLIIAGYLFVTKLKVSLKYVIIFILAGASAITLLGMARDFNKGLNFYEKIKMSLNEKDVNKESSISPQTEELARSVNALNTAMNYVPVKHDYFYGRFQFQYLAQMVPFISIFYPIIFDDNSPKFRGSATFITWIIQGDFPTSGNGTSVMADFYFDFGWIGIVIGMFLFGYLMRLSEIIMYSNTLPFLFAHIFFTVYLCSAIYIARASLLESLQLIVWIYIVLVINKYFFGAKGQKRHFFSVRVNKNIFRDKYQSKNISITTFQ